MTLIATGVSYNTLGNFLHQIVIMRSIKLKLTSGPMDQKLILRSPI